jgi:hypothetical protein
MSPVRTALLAAVALVVATGAAPAPTDHRGPIANCQSSVQNGAETDTCVGNPDSPGGPDAGPGLVVRPEFCFGFGIVVGNCGDD